MHRIASPRAGLNSAFNGGRVPALVGLAAVFQHRR